MDYYRGSETPWGYGPKRPWLPYGVAFVAHSAPLPPPGDIIKGALKAAVIVRLREGSLSAYGLHAHYFSYRNREAAQPRQRDFSPSEAEPLATTARGRQLSIWPLKGQRIT